MESILSHFASGEPVVFLFFLLLSLFVKCSIGGSEISLFPFLIILISLLFAYVLL